MAGGVRAEVAPSCQTSRWKGEWLKVAISNASLISSPGK